MMSQLSKLLVSALLVCSANAMATPVAFNVSSVTLTPGSGYGIDGNENSGATLLGVNFTTTTSAPFSSSLNAVGDFWYFKVAGLSFVEPSTGGGIETAETDNLGVTAVLTFTDPLASVKTLTATGVATAGSVNDNAADYVLTWTPLTNIAFGDGGLFDISLNTITFSGIGDKADLFATLTLRALPSGVTQAAVNVPEPGSLALIALALILVALTTRRRRDMNA